MHCISCGAELKPGAKFCTKCGMKQPEIPAPGKTRPAAPVEPAVSVEPAAPVAPAVPAAAAATVPPPPVPPADGKKAKKAKKSGKKEKKEKKSKTWLIVLLSVLGALIAAAAVLYFTGVVDFDALLHGGKKDSQPDKADAAETAVAAADVKLGFIFLHDESDPYDANAIAAAKNACENAGVAYELRMNVATGDACYEAAKELADAGCTMVFADRIDYEEGMLRAAEEYPDVQFCNAGGGSATDNPPANFHYARAAVCEGEYLAGVAAGMKLNELKENGDIKKQKLGFVAPFPYDEMVTAYSAFFLGAKSVCPDVKMDVAVVGSWYSEESERELAKAMVTNGCAVIARMTDSTAVPAFCESKGTVSVNWNNAASVSAPNTGLVYVAINWQPYFEYLIDCATGGKTVDAEWTGHLSDGTVVVDGLNGDCAASGTADKLSEVRDSINAGILDVMQEVNDLDPVDFEDDSDSQQESSNPRNPGGIYNMD